MAVTLIIINLDQYKPNTAGGPSRQVTGYLAKLITKTVPALITTAAYYHSHIHLLQALSFISIKSASSSSASVIILIDFTVVVIIVLTLTHCCILYSGVSCYGVCRRRVTL